MAPLKNLQTEDVYGLYFLEKVIEKEIFPTLFASKGGYAYTVDLNNKDGLLVSSRTPIPLKGSYGNSSLMPIEVPLHQRSPKRRVSKHWSKLLYPLRLLRNLQVPYLRSTNVFSMKCINQQPWKPFGGPFFYPLLLQHLKEAPPTYGIGTVVLDLYKNRGGDITVTPAFLAYITTNPYDLSNIQLRPNPMISVNKYLHYNMIQILRGYWRALVSTPRKKYTTSPAKSCLASLPLPFNTRLEKKCFTDVLTSGVTFNSARLSLLV